MDFANERYVRYYTRDTTTWLLLTRDGQALLGPLLRMVDRAGVLDLAGLTPAEAVHARLPKWSLEELDRGLRDLARRHVIALEQDRIVWPRFLEGQEAQPTNAARKRKYRELRAAGIPVRGVTCDPPSTCHEDEAESLEEAGGLGTQRSRLSPPALPSCAEPSLAELNQEEQRARAAAAPEPDGPKAKGPIRSSAGSPAEGKDPGDGRDLEAEVAAVVGAYCRAYHERRGRVAAVRKVDRDAVLELFATVPLDQVLARIPVFLDADTPFLRGRGWPLYALARTWNELDHDERDASPAPPPQPPDETGVFDPEQLAAWTEATSGETTGRRAWVVEAKRLERRINQGTFRSWIVPLEYVSTVEGEHYVAAPSAVFVELLEGKRAEWGIGPEFRFVVKVPAAVPGARR